ncbi:MAG: 1-deoxy-D-xylulose-5-phosphate reductoisomerase [Actinomycetota bacterium]|jgi:1-deoxy-D-xylulose-5-phosphate reductoisomerase|nr:1-deoxy-D-xylulose-5-phosphate reductoisomerase [Actinomycetota bacterium]
MKRRVVILGSTGSIGRQALEVIDAHPDLFEVAGLVAGSNAQELAEQASAHGNVRTALGEDGAIEFAALEEADVVLNAIVGAAGLRASLAALEAGTTLALANKESLVAGGELCLAAAAASGATIVPVDSEHAAIAQCLEGRDPSTVARIHLTASGGPFRERYDLAGVTPDDALAHPTWSMGPKITIDSATMMNKGLEVIEAHFLFDIDYSEIEVVVHPESVIHGMVELVDGSLLMSAGPTDMRIPIQAALTAPDRVGSGIAPLDPRTLGELHFERVDRTRFPTVELAYTQGRRGGTYPAVMNAANEVAVAGFLDGTLAFTDIVPVIEEVLANHEDSDAASLDHVLKADGWARIEAATAIKKRTPVGAGS